MNNLIIALFSLILGGVLAYVVIFRSKLQQVTQYNQSLAGVNQTLEEEYQSRLKACDELQERLTQTEKDYTSIAAKKDELLSTLDALKQVQTEAAENYYKSALDIAEQHYEAEIAHISEDLEQRRKDINEEYTSLLCDAKQGFETQIKEQQQQLLDLTAKLKIARQNVDLAVKQAQQKMEIENKQDYYRVCLSDDDRIEVARLRQVQLRDKTPINKVIYKVYYEKPLTDMIGRVVGPGSHTGIYKITNIDNQMCYVGQAVDIATRWKTHCRRGIGAEGQTQNKLYPAMYAAGVERFTFEILEECSRADLDKREDYWQDYFHAKDFGYSQR